MLILAIRTDKPEAELYLMQKGEKIAAAKWTAHRELAETIHQKIDALLQSKNKNLHDVTAVLVYSGPGSFTGLRIGVSVANALAYGLGIPIVGVSGDDWLTIGAQALMSGQNQQMVAPNYGAPVRITSPKK